MGRLFAFFGQCTLLASSSASFGLNLPVYKPSTLLTKHFSNPSVLPLSLAVKGDQDRFPFLFDDPRSILPILQETWKRIEIFCWPSVAKSYALIGLL